MRLISLTAAIAAIALSTGIALADTVTPFDDATGTGPWEITSTAVTDSGVAVNLSTLIQFSTISTLSATFTDHTGGAYGGAPRFVLYADNGDKFFVYLGTPPSFADNDPAAFTTAFSGTNLDNGTSNSAFGPSGSYVSFASLQANYGTDQINKFIFVDDGGWGANGAHDLTLDSLNLNGTIYNTNVSATPLPASLPLFASGLGTIALLMRKKRRAAMPAH